MMKIINEFKSAATRKRDSSTGSRASSQQDFKTVIDGLDDEVTGASLEKTPEKRNEARNTVGKQHLEIKKQISGEWR